MTSRDARAPAHRDHWREDLERVLRSAWDDAGVRVREAEPYGSGHSGFTYAVVIDAARHAGRYVLRLSPPGARIAGPADIGRQGRIMAALGVAGLPVPRILVCDSHPVLAGRSFALMELVSGEPFDAIVSRSPAAAIAGAAVDFLRRMQELAPERTGIGDERPMTLAGELERWAGLMSRAPEWLRGISQALRDQLAAALPSDRPPRLVHGDFHYGNMLFDGPRLVAVLDWEIAQLGHPDLDLGCLAVASLRRRYGSEPNPTGSLDISIVELAGLYGVTAEAIAWPTAFTCYKYAAILGYNLGLHLAGKRPDPVYPTLTGTMRGLLEDGVRIVDHGVDGL